MANESFFLTKTKVAPGEILQVGTGMAIQRHAALRECLMKLGGPEVADLFAEPVFRADGGDGPLTISWYCARQGEPTPLTKIDDEGLRSAAEAMLTQRLTTVARGLKDSEFAPLVGGALHIRSLDDVYVFGDRPVIVNWGMVPEGVMADRAARDSHFAATLGRFLPLDEAPPVSSEEWRARLSGVMAVLQAQEAAPAAGMAVEGAVPHAAAARPAAAAAPAAETLAAGRVEVVDRTGRWRWLPLGVLLLLAVLTLIWLSLPGNLLYPTAAPARAIGDADVIAAAEAANETLQERRDALRDALNGAVCTPSGDLVLPERGGLRPDGTAPLPQDGSGERLPGAGPRVEEGQPDALLPPSPDRLQVPQEGGDPTSLLSFIEDRTAIVLVRTASGGGAGTGFFIGPDLLITNHHVAVGEGDVQEIMVTNERLGQLTPARFLEANGPLETTGQDFALLRVQGANSPFFKIWSGTQTLKLQNVIAAGFPASYMETDADWQRLLAGDRGAVPGVVVTRGSVNAEQNFGSRTRAIVHSADISSGNSGGPLVDSCGRVIGVNTFGRQDEITQRFLNFSLHASELLKFTDQASAQVQADPSACRPQVAQQLMPPALEAPGEAPGEAPAPDAAAPDAETPDVEPAVRPE